MSTKYIVNNVTGQTINGNLTINGDVVITGNTNTRPYKVYTALLTQIGDGTTTLTNGTLDIGKVYEITNYQSGDDFTNVANVIDGTINTTGCKFIATGTTPDVWTNSTELRDTSAPVPTVLENTLGSDIIWNRAGVGYYNGSNINFSDASKVFILFTSNYSDEGYGNIKTVSGEIYDDGIDNKLWFATFDSNNTLNDYWGTYIFLEIRVYN